MHGVVHTRGYPCMYRTYRYERFGEGLFSIVGEKTLRYSGSMMAESTVQGLKWANKTFSTEIPKFFQRISRFSFLALIMLRCYITVPYVLIFIASLFIIAEFCWSAHFIFYMTFEFKICNIIVWMFSLLQQWLDLMCLWESSVWFWDPLEAGGESPWQNSTLWSS